MAALLAHVVSPHDDDGEQGADDGDEDIGESQAGERGLGLEAGLGIESDAAHDDAGREPRDGEAKLDHPPVHRAVHAFASGAGAQFVKVADISGH